MYSTVEVEKCETPTAARERALRTIQKRREFFKPPAPIKPPVPIVPDPVEIPFSILVRAAYPQRYPDEPIYPDADPSVKRPRIIEIQRAVCEAFGIKFR